MTQLVQTVIPSSVLHEPTQSRNISDVSSHQNLLRRGRGNNNRGRGGRQKFYNNIDITDATRSFTREEWSSFPTEVITDIITRRNQSSSNSTSGNSYNSRGSYRGGQNNRGRGSGGRSYAPRNVAAVNSDNFDNMSQISGTVAADATVQNNSNNNSSSISSNTNNRTSFGRGAYNGGNGNGSQQRRTNNASAILSSERRSS